MFNPNDFSQLLNPNFASLNPGMNFLNPGFPGLGLPQLNLGLLGQPPPNYLNPNIMNNNNQLTLQQPVPGMSNLGTSYFQAPSLPNFGLFGNPQMGGAMNINTLQKASTTGVQQSFCQLFVKDIADNVTDQFMEKLLITCGELVQWKRNKNQKGEPNTFGFAEYKTIDGVLKCLRLIDNLKIKEKNLKVNPSERTELFIKEWKELKRKEWSLQQEGENPNFNSFDHFLQKDDESIKKKIQDVMRDLDNEIQRVRRIKEQEEEQKEHPKQKERELQQREHYQNLERKAQQKIDDWLKQEDSKKQRQKREKEAQKQKKQQKIQYLEQEQNYDSQVERQKKGRHLIIQRKRFRMRQFQDDEYQRRKEQKNQQRENELQNQLNLQNQQSTVPELPELPCEDGQINQDHQLHFNHHSLSNFDPHSFQIPKNMEEEQNKEMFTKVTFTYHNEDDGVMKNQNDKPSASTQGSILGFNLNNRGSAPSKTALSGFVNDNQDQDANQDQKKKFNFPLKALEQKRAEQQQLENERNQILNQYMAQSGIQTNFSNTTFNNSMVQLQQDSKNEKAEEKNNDVLTTSNFSNTNANNNNSTNNKPKDNKLQDIEHEVKKLSQAQLIEAPINWTNFAKRNTLELFIRPWIATQCIQYLGQEEQVFINSILKKLINKEGFQKVSKVVSKVLDDDTQSFMIDLWRLIRIEGIQIERESN